MQDQALERPELREVGLRGQGRGYVGRGLWEWAGLCEQGLVGQGLRGAGPCRGRFCRGTVVGAGPGGRGLKGAGSARQAQKQVVQDLPVMLGVRTSSCKRWGSLKGAKHGCDLIKCVFLKAPYGFSVKDDGRGWGI